MSDLPASDCKCLLGLSAGEVSPSTQSPSSHTAEKTSRDFFSQFCKANVLNLLKAHITLCKHLLTPSVLSLNNLKFGHGKK